MAIDILNLDEHDGLLHVAFKNTWTWEEFDAMHAQVESLLNEAAQPLHCLLDFTFSRHIPSGMAEHVMPYMRNVEHPRLSSVTLAGLNDSQRILLDTIRRAFPRQAVRIVVVQTVEEAYQRLGRSYAA